MANHLKLLIVLFLFFFHGVNAQAESNVNYPDSLKQLNTNFITFFKNETKIEEKELLKLLSDMDKKGSWKNIDYTTKQRGNWPVVEHLKNVNAIAVAYKTKGTQFYQKKSVSRKIHLALNYWLKNDFQSDNWWYPQIGTLKILAPILILMEDELTENEIKLAMPILDRAKIGMTGQNKVWLSANVLMRSLLTKDINSVDVATKSIREELRISMKEGIQPDWSYQQHGAQLQFGNYGLHYIEDMSKWMEVFRNTPFAFEDSKMAILRNYILNGQQWVIWKNAMDINACGRQLFIDEPVRKKVELLHYVGKMKNIDPEYADEYSSMFNAENTIGNRFFYRTDFHVQRTKDYYFSVKMCSNRVLGAESCNSENMLGYYMGDGVALLYQTEKEFENIFPFWDWKKVPGITVSQDTAALPVLTAWGYHIQSDFVGGVSDGENGIAVMKYNRDNVQANKSWFMFNDMIVCLGNGINSSRNFDITTSVNQTFLKGEVIFADDKGMKQAAISQTIENPKWLLHDNVGYLFPKGGKVQLETKTVTGSWNKVVGYYSSEQKTADIFKLWLNHGMKPQEERYAFILVPNSTKNRMMELEQSTPFNIINEKNIQIVKSADGNVAGIVYYEAGRAEIFGGITAHQPCVLMLKKTDAGIALSVADPTQKADALTLTFDKTIKFEHSKLVNGATEISIKLPKGFDAGKTISTNLTH